ncbi:hypothetical protein Sme01_06710 [Sphaerisporangium melleum]|uniref:Uncharacterized protein n=1 Tax=Sphaerisporangium melleum TaxID=321316 RepID=A0A917VSK2_9ACTN|nr:hypothetical protein GCM10007964_65560 [Sphaerisporangium melleum]GII68195.1 hypothetical protein Sme01_06710 [Sphaerisporangium melleum]
MYQAVLRDAATPIQGRLHRAFGRWSEEKGFPAADPERPATEHRVADSRLGMRHHGGCGRYVLDEPHDGGTLRTAAVFLDGIERVPGWVMVTVERLGPGQAGQGAARAPGFVPAYLRTQRITDGAIHLEDAAVVLAEQEVSHFLHILTEPRRRAPIAVVTPGPGSAERADWLAAAVAGAALVVRLADRHTEELFNQAVGERLGVYGGAIRTYAAPFDPASERHTHRHPPMSPAKLRDEGEAALAKIANAMVGRAAGMDLPDEVHRALPVVHRVLAGRSPSAALATAMDARAGSAAPARNRHGDRADGGPATGSRGMPAAPPKPGPAGTPAGGRSVPAAPAGVPAPPPGGPPEVRETGGGDAGVREPGGPGGTPEVPAPRPGSVLVPAPRSGDAPTGPADRLLAGPGLPPAPSAAAGPAERDVMARPGQDTVAGPTGQDTGAGSAGQPPPEPASDEPAGREYASRLARDVAEAVVREVREELETALGLAADLDTGQQLLREVRALGLRLDGLCELVLGDPAQQERPDDPDGPRPAYELLQEEYAEAVGTSRALAERVRRLEGMLAELGHPMYGVAPPEEVFQPDSLAEALIEARSRLTHVVIGETDAPAVRLDNTYPGLRRSWAGKAWDALHALNDFARARSSGEFAGGFYDWCAVGEPGRYTVPAGMLVMRESRSVATRDKFRDPRTFPVPVEVDPRGEILMEAHIKLRAVGYPAPRMHFHDDSGGATGKVYVGYLGAHLPNTRTN